MSMTPKMYETLQREVGALPAPTALGWDYGYTEAQMLAYAQQARDAVVREMNSRFEAIERTMYLRGDALEFAEYLATQAECLLSALEREDMARVAWDESGAGTPEFERWDNATEARCEYATKLRERIYEFRKRVPEGPNDGVKR